MAKRNWSRAKRNALGYEQAVFSRREVAKENAVRPVDTARKPSDNQRPGWGIVTHWYEGPDFGPYYKYQNQLKDR